MIHHSKLDPEDVDGVLVCDNCGFEDSHASNGDCSYCTECYAVEQGFTTSYLGLDGETYLETEIDWSDFESLIGV